MKNCRIKEGTLLYKGYSDIDFFYVQKTLVIILNLYTYVLQIKLFCLLNVP